MTVLAPTRHAGIVLPDNVLFGSGAGETIRFRVLASFDYQTLLRRPSGIVSSLGVTANVPFIDTKPPSESATVSAIWVCIRRTNKRFPLGRSP